MEHQKKIKDRMMERRKRLLIIGTGSLRNYGCEAIVQGTYAIIKRYLPDWDIYLGTEDKQYDRNLLPNDIHLVTYKKRFTLYRLWRGILRRFFHIGKGSAVRMDYNIGKKYDAVLSCGGDNFCQAPDGTIYDLLVDLMRIGDMTHNSGGKYVLWGASVGPFMREKNRKRVFENLEKTDLICVREELSYNYIAQDDALKSRIRLVADPAFCMKPDKNVEFEKKQGFIYIGLNLSLLATEQIVSDKGVNNLFQLFDDILRENSNYIFVCIPHVVLQNSMVQNDSLFLGEYVKFTKYSDRVLMLPPSLKKEKTKGYVAKMDLLIAARMHCCVGGISTATPTLFITYSNKGKGMAYYAYKHHEYDIEVAQLLTSRFPLLVNKMVNERKEIKAYLETRQQNFVDDAMQGGIYLCDVLNK